MLSLFVSFDSFSSSLILLYKILIALHKALKKALEPFINCTPVYTIWDLHHRLLYFTPAHTFCTLDIIKLLFGDDFLYDAHRFAQDCQDILWTPYWNSKFTIFYHFVEYLHELSVSVVSAKMRLWAWHS